MRGRESSDWVRLSGTHLVVGTRGNLGLLELWVCGVWGVDGGESMGLCRLLMVERDLRCSGSMEMVGTNKNFLRSAEQFPPDRRRGKGRRGMRVKREVRFINMHGAKPKLVYVIWDQFQAQIVLGSVWYLLK